VEIVVDAACCLTPGLDGAYQDTVAASEATDGVQDAAKSFWYKSQGGLDSPGSGGLLPV